MVSTPPSAHEIQHGRAVLAGRRVVVKTEQQNLVDRRADLVLRRFDQPEPQIAAGIMDVVEVTGDFAGRREEHDPRCMRELIALRVVRVAKADRVGQPLDRLLTSVRKCQPRRPPASRSCGHRSVFFAAAISVVSCGSKLTVTTSNSLPIVNGSFSHAQHQTVEHLRAEHGAAEIRQHENDRLLSLKYFRQRARAGLRRRERQIERHLLVQPLVETDVLQDFGGEQSAPADHSRQNASETGLAHKSQMCQAKSRGLHRDAPRNMRPEFDAPESTSPLSLEAPAALCGRGGVRRAIPLRGGLEYARIPFPGFLRKVQLILLWRQSQVDISSRGLPPGDPPPPVAVSPAAHSTDVRRDGNSDSRRWRGVAVSRGRTHTQAKRCCADADADNRT